ncbi:MAG: hypothetical protein IKK75_13950 [Clostridia bacterium]|nr:hypothetical protein [Clostridia bacterium]
MLSVKNSENPRQSLATTDEDGNRIEILYMTCNLRPGGGYSLNVELLNAERVGEDLNAVQNAVAAFFANSLARAAEMGLPVPVVGGGNNA